MPREVGTAEEVADMRRRTEEDETKSGERKFECVRVIDGVI